MRSRQRIPRPVPVVVGLALAMTLAACGSAGSGGASAPSSGSTASAGATQASSPASTQPSASAAGSSSAGSQSLQQLVAAAKKEGSLTWYTAYSEDDLAPMIKAFNKVYPDIKVNPLRLNSDQAVAKINTEQKAGKPQADVVSADAPQMAELLQGGDLQPYHPTDAPPLPAGLNLPEGYGNVLYVLTTSIAYNPVALKAKGLPVPTSFEDFTKPEWKGNFSVKSGAGTPAWYGDMIGILGRDKAAQLLRGIGNNSPRLVSSHTLAVTQVLAGDPVATISSYGYKVAETLRKDPSAHIKFINTNPLPAFLTLINVVKGAPHPSAAKLFVHWITSQAGQEADVQVTDHPSLRTDVKDDPTVWNPATWKPAWGNPDMTVSDYNKLVQEVNSALHIPS